LIDNLPLVADMIEQIMQEADSAVRNLSRLSEGAAISEVHSPARQQSE